jgi:hypothetical protein
MSAATLVLVENTLGTIEAPTTAAFGPMRKIGSVIDRGSGVAGDGQEIGVAFASPVGT